MQQEVDALVDFFISSGFVKNSWGKDIEVIRGAGICFLEASRLAKNLPRLIVRHAQRAQRLTKVIHDGTSSTLAPGQTQQEILDLTKQYSMVLYGIQYFNWFYGTLSNELRNFYNYPESNVGAFISLHKTKGLMRHRDPYHVFVFQHQGVSTWRIYDRRNKRLLYEKTLNPGDILYVPKGFYHEVERLTEVTCHVSIGIGPEAPKQNRRRKH